MAFGDDNDITITVTLDGEDADAKLERLGRTIQDVGDKAHRADSGFSRLQASIVTLQAGVDIASRAFGALRSVATEVFDQLERARVVEGLTNSFNKLQGGTEKAGQVMNQLKSATSGLISEFDLMQQANQAVLLGS